MGTANSSPAQIPEPQSVRFSLRVVKVFRNSPGFKAGFESFLDFIFEIETISGERSNFIQVKEPETPSSILAGFYKVISENANKQLVFTLYNVYSQKSRQISLIPNRDWENADSFLGILVRLEEMETALERTLKVLNVLKDSPAEKCGLIAENDYILGLTYYKYRDVNEFKAMLEIEEEKDKEICVFSQKTGEVRHISIKTNKDWGGKGLLGCEFGFGYRNQLKPGLEQVEAKDSPIRQSFNGEQSRNDEDSIIKEKMYASVEKLEKSKKLKVPPKNPFPFVKKASFEKPLDKGFDYSRIKINSLFLEKDFLEIEFSGQPKYENPPRKGEACPSPQIIDKANKRGDISEAKSNNSSFLFGSLETEKSVEKSEDGEEKPSKSKTIGKKYSFFSRRLNGDYVIRSEDLFQMDLQIN